MFWKSIKKTIEDRYYRESTKNEDGPILNFFSSLPKDKKYDLLEVGSGLGRFAELIKNNFNESIDITCLEINKDLAEKTTKIGIKTINKNFLNNELPDEKFDLVHCSHVVEHMPYPDIKNFLDELVRVAKNGGYVIIRSPLMHKGFYKNIDHVRPYPPNSIMDYFTNSLQQETGKYKIKNQFLWLRKEPLNLNIPGLRFLNLLLKLVWIYFKFPHAHADGYVLILKKV